jgi:class 3 adenylate cyclase
MGLKADLDTEVGAIFRSSWSERDGRVVPDDSSIQLGNDGVNLEATVLYADMADSTVLVDNYSAKFAAEVYKAFLRVAAKIISSENGTITAYDGDRVMAVYMGDYTNTRAVRTGLKINWACKNIIQPALNRIYTNTQFTVKHVVGVDTSKLFVARAGIRGANDLVWIGRAANYAAKLSAMDDMYPTWITDTVYDAMIGDMKIHNGQNRWEARSWTPMAGKTIYRSAWSWVVP